ncbi:MAG: hypothetical protein AAGH92_01970 [Planctomycetota bacterium]
MSKRSREFDIENFLWILIVPWFLSSGILAVPAWRWLVITWYAQQSLYNNSSPIADIMKWELITQNGRHIEIPEYVQLIWVAIMFGYCLVAIPTAWLVWWFSGRTSRNNAIKPGM